jgi:hypothetical protein
MKLGYSQFFRLMNAILNHRWMLAVSVITCSTVSLFAMHTFASRSYSSSGLLGMASGLGVIAGIWLAYSLARRNNNP